MNDNFVPRREGSKLCQKQYPKVILICVFGASKSVNRPIAGTVLGVAALHRSALFTVPDAKTSLSRGQLSSAFPSVRNSPIAMASRTMPTMGLCAS